MPPRFAGSLRIAVANTNRALPGRRPAGRPTPGQAYDVHVEVLRCGLIGHEDRMNALRIDGINVGHCTVGTSNDDCSFHGCASQLRRSMVAATSVAIDIEADFNGHSHSCDCDKATWQCASAGSQAGWSPMTAVVRVTLTQRDPRPPSPM